LCVGGRGRVYIGGVRREGGGESNEVRQVLVDDMGEELLEEVRQLARKDAVNGLELEVSLVVGRGKKARDL